MNAASTRRAALVAALLGLLAFLGGGVLPAHAGAPLAAYGDATAAVGAQLASPTSTVGDDARSAQPSAARTSGHERTPAPYPVGPAVAAALLLLVAAALAVGVRRAARRSTLPAGRRVLAARAPPVLAS